MLSKYMHRSCVQNRDTLSLLTCKAFVGRNSQFFIDYSSRTFCEFFSGRGTKRANGVTVQ